MIRNVLTLILLLFSLQFSSVSCSAFRPISYVEPVRETIDPFEPVAPVEPKVEDALRGQVVDYARQFLGTRYKIAGKKPDTGFDCSGFTGYIMGQYGIQLSASSKYQEKDGKAIPVSEVQQGDLLFFRREKAGTVFHVAIVISNDQDGLFVIHSTSQRGVVIDNISESSYWRAKYATACRVINP
jgi:cell wall-associated NlpC family hydrolase